MRESNQLTRVRQGFKFLKGLLKKITVFEPLRENFFGFLRCEDYGGEARFFRQGILKSTFLGYAQVFFSTKWYVGLIFLAATFIIPAKGAAGLFALFLSNLWASLLGFPREHIKQGYFAYNGLLTGLALGLSYAVNIPFFIMLLIATLLGVLIAASLRSLFENYLYVPVLSLPFVLTTWLVLAGGRKFHGLIYPVESYGEIFLKGIFSSPIEFFVQSLGAAFFQLSVLSGVLVAVGILIFSRQAFILTIIGLISGSAVFILLKGDTTELTAGLIGFNFALTAIAVGGVWVIPGPDSFILASFGGILCAIIAAASAFLLNLLGLPPLAFPFVVTTCLVIYALKHRGISLYFRTVSFPEDTPEKNLKRHKNVRTRFVTGEIPVFELPISGEWFISQGFNGEHTHRDLWAHAWDFEIIDGKKRAYKVDGSRPEDFYAFNMPVFAPADGKIITVVKHIEDNPIGHVDTENNWGNIVVIWHYGNIYTAYCHLKKRSINVEEGEVIRKGQIIGKVGNSGRSPTPHLHFQAQLSHEVGAPTTPSELMHYINVHDGTFIYHTHGSPARGDIIRPLQTENHIFNSVSFPLGRSWTFLARQGGKEWEETWETNIDFGSNRHLTCREQNARIRFFVNKKVLLFMDYEGPRNTGLNWFFLGLPRLPMTTGNICWEDELPGELILSSPARILFDLCEPVFSLVRLSSSSKFIKGNDWLSIETELKSTGLLARNGKMNIRAVTKFEQQRGLISLNIENSRETLFELESTGIPSFADADSLLK